MLFSSYVFVLFFLPAMLAGFAVIDRLLGRRGAVAWLTAGSLFYYGWWNPQYVLLLGASMAFNYTMGRVTVGRKAVLFTGVAANLLLLGYYKYSGFFIDTVQTLTGSHIPWQNVMLPLGISFFTFQQIAYLVDAHRGETREHHFIDYCLFVTFFPQLIAGPIVHHREMLPQFSRSHQHTLTHENLAVGLTMFVMGLMKKVLIADELATIAGPVFAQAGAGHDVTTAAAWLGALSYSLQLYFDFSGYSDMAVGLGRMFGIRLPVNFDSPYKAVSPIDFWKRWHITLSRFLRDYLYIPLGGNRRGKARRYVNLMLTMLLGGLWHGAGWTFVVWGALHGAYLMCNHALRAMRGDDRSLSRGGAMAGRAATFIGVVAAWVVFRATSFDAAWRMLRAMAGGAADAAAMKIKADQVAEVAVLLAVVWVMPNSQQIMRRYRPTLGRRPTWDGPALLGRLRWSAHPLWAWATGAALIACLMQLSRVQEFIYYQF
ncbi:MAG: MBOAT family protein [Phycisphaeraceae bacterium]